MPNQFQTALEDLTRLGRRDDIDSAVLILRVLSDLFAARPYHAPEEVRQFEEIVNGLIDKVDDASAARLAERLAEHPHVPARLLDRLSARTPAAAAAILARCRTIEPTRIAAIAAWGPAELAAAIAARSDLDSALVDTLAARPEREILLALANNEHATIPRTIFRQLAQRGRDDSDLARALLTRGDPAESMPLFLHANHDERANILAAALRQDLGRALASLRHDAQPCDAETVKELEQAAFKADKLRFAKALDETLDLGLPAARRIVEDHGIEPLAITLAALSLEHESLARILLFLDPAIGHSVARFDQALKLAETFPVATARRLLGAMTGSMLARRRLRAGGLVDRAAQALPGRAASGATSVAERNPAGDAASERKTG